MRIGLLLMVLMMAFASCRSTKQITTVIAKKDSAVVVVNPADTDSAKSVRATLDKIKGKKNQLHHIFLKGKSGVQR